MPFDAGQTDVATAVDRAADVIEDNPERYRFIKGKIPDCRTPGCALGWVGAFLGFQARQDHRDRISQVCGFSNEARFYVWMFNNVGKDWMRDTSVCAAGLRKLAAEIREDKR